MENKTAVEWLLENIPDLGKYIPFGVSMELHAKFQQAIELEKQQIIAAYQWGRTDQNSDEKKWYNRNARIYYSETYNKPTT